MRTTRQIARSLSEELVSDGPPGQSAHRPDAIASGSLDGLLASREIVSPVGPGEWARRQLQPPQQRWQRGATVGKSSSSPSIPLRGSRTHSVWKGSETASDAFPTRPSRRRSTSAWRVVAAMLDTKAVVGRAHTQHAPDERTRDEILHNLSMARSRRGSSRATTTSRWSACTRYTPAATTT